MDIVLSYSRDQDLELDKAGHKFLDVCQDKNGGEVHVFQLIGKVAQEGEQKEALEPIPALDVAGRLADLIQAERDPVARQVLEAARQQLLCLHEVHALLDGQEYDSDTPCNVESCLTEVGFVIRDLSDMDESEDNDREEG